MNDEKRYEKGILLWSWLLPLAYLVHILEEYAGGEGYSAYMARVRGVSITNARFLFLQAIGWGLMLLGIYLSRRLRFLEWMLACLGMVEAANGVSHTITAFAAGAYNPGLVTGLLIFIPLGAIIVSIVRKRMSAGRYATALAVGLGIQAVVSLLALSGGRTHPSG